MKRKRIVVYIVAAAVVSAGIWLLFRPKALGNISHSYTEPATSSSNFSFSGEAGKRIKISFASDVKSGDLKIAIYDSNRNIVCELDKAKELVTYHTFDNTDTYILAAEYADFVGNFSVEVYPMK